MATCENGILCSIFELVRLAGGLSNKSFTVSTSISSPRFSATAIATSASEIFLYCYKDEKFSFKIIPWCSNDIRRPSALAFSPTAEWLLVACEDGSLFIVPLAKLFGNVATSQDYRFSTTDVVIWPANGNRAKPTALVWWQTVAGDASLAVIGTELGELCFIELVTGKEVGGTYITVPVTELYICRDNALDTVYLLITGTEDRQWRLVLEQKSNQYLFPLENIASDWASSEGGDLVGSLAQTTAGPTPRSRLMGLKQLSVEKLQLLRQRLSDAKHVTKKKPLTENKGVDTFDIDDVTTTSIASQAESDSASQSTAQPHGSFNIDGDASNHISTRPERLSKYIYDVVATPHYAKERYLLAGHYKPNSCLMVYSTDLENTPLYVFKLPEDASGIILHDELIFCLKKKSPSQVTILSTFFSASTNINGDIDSKINPVLQDVHVPANETIIQLFPAPPFVFANEDDKDAEDDLETDVQLPSRTNPNGCLILTKTSLYVCQTRKSIENLFMELTLRSGDIEAANKLGVVFSLDPKLFEVAADAKLQNRSFAAAISLYKHSRCPHVKCSLKFAWAGYVTEFLTYMNTLTSGPGGPDLGTEQRRHLANLAVIAYLHQLSFPAGTRTPTQQQTTLRHLLLHLRHNLYYDELFVLALAATTWRWETLQYVSTSRGLLLEKLNSLLSLRISPVMSNLPAARKEENSFPMERESGFLHCFSDPELRNVLLLKPNMAMEHMNFVLSNVNTFDLDTLRRLASLYDPTQSAIQPFISVSSYFKRPSYSSSQSSGTISNVFDDQIDIDLLTQVFIAVIIQLNKRRSWVYDPDLLNLRTVEVVKKEPFFESSIVPKRLTCGYGHSGCIIGHTLYTWGQGDYGVLGHGPKASTSDKFLEGIDSTLFHELEQLTLNDMVDNVPSTGSQLYPDGALTRDTNGECLDPRPVAYFSNMKVYAVSSGKNHALAITDYGVYGWGSCRFGQVGSGSTGRHCLPVLLSTLVDKEVILVSCGQFHSLCVTKSGRLYSWGWNVHGQLGHNSVEDILQPSLVKALSKKTIVQAEGGYAHSVALTSKGTVYAWGCSTYGQVGVGGIVKIIRPVKVPLPNVTHLASGYFHNIAVTEDHRVFTWGCNPACLRVQAQLQKHNRSKDAEKYPGDGRKEEPVPTDEGQKCSPAEEVPDGVGGDKDISNFSPEAGVRAEPTLVPKEEDSQSPESGLQTPKSGSGYKLVSANTVPSCDPLELGHLLPKDVDMPHGYGAVRAIAGGNQHSLLLTTHGVLYSWGRNMAGQLGTGNRREVPIPTAILDDINVTDIACGSDFNLAIESQGQVWAWGSNYYSQLGKGNSPCEGKGQSNKVFMLRTTKRVLKVPQSLHSNVETPRIVAGLPLLASLKVQRQRPSSPVDCNLNNNHKFNNLQLSSVVGQQLQQRDTGDDDGVYGTDALHTSLSLLYSHYSAKNIIKMLNEAEAHQALATLYTLERKYSRAMHHQLCSLLRQAPPTEPLQGADVGGSRTLEGADEGGSGTSLANNHTSSHVKEAVRIMDHYLRLQTEESQSGMRGVLQEGIGLWLSHSLPLPQLEDLLLDHLPRTVYPLALLLFGEENPSFIRSEDLKESNSTELEEATAKVLSQLSTKFCLNLCSSVISHLQAGECNVEQLETLSKLAKPNVDSPRDSTRPSEDTLDTSSKDVVVTAAITLSPDEVINLKKAAAAAAAEESPAASTSAIGDGAAPRTKPKSGGKERSSDKDAAVLFTCGHNFTAGEFQNVVLPQLEKTVTTVPGLLGKTARVLLDQYHSDQPQMACPHCVLAHLTIKLTKHNQAT